MSSRRPSIIASRDHRRRPTIADDDLLHGYFSLSPEAQEKRYKKMTKSQQAEVRMTADGSGILWLHPDTNEPIEYEDLGELLESRTAPVTAHINLRQENEQASGSLMSAIVLPSCVKSKPDHSCKAAEMDTNPLFQKMMA